MTPRLRPLSGVRERAGVKAGANRGGSRRGHPALTLPLGVVWPLRAPIPLSQAGEGEVSA